jgi:pyruvate/2-oxoacid:ferredoxin oxidoreductase beta subunit
MSTQRMTRAQVPMEEMILAPGSTCQGCGAAMAARLTFKVLGPNLIRHGIPCCPDQVSKHPRAGAVFEGGGASLTGTSRGLKAIGRTDVKAVGFFGDGGTYDIGFQGLSAAAERNENILVITKDNEAYMNTGGQRSGGTPKYAETTTNPVGPNSRGKNEPKKNIPMIFAAHYVPYIATASVAFPEDLMQKVKYAKDIEGFRMILIQSPCPVGWRFDPAKTIELARAGVQAGVWPLYEIEHGTTFKLNYKPKELKPVSEYLKPQSRFRHMTEVEVNEIQASVTANWQRLLKADDMKTVVL